MRLSFPAATLFCGLWLALVPAQAQEVLERPQPEASTGLSSRSLVQAPTEMVAAANPLAAEAGLAILEAGGNAVDAMVAVQLVLGLVEPQSSGIGGGAFLLYFDALEGRLTSFDGRETTPRAATPQLFLGPDGQPLEFMEAVVGGRSVGTPGTVKLLFEVHGRYGQLSWRRVVEPAIQLAERGFAVSPRLHTLLVEDAERLRGSQGTRDYFYTPAGEPLPAGHMLRNEAYAETLRRIAVEGQEGFYEGPVAEAMVAAVRGAAGNPGVLALQDLADYEIVEREPVCLAYREFDVCGMGPPSSGALAVGQILGMIEPFDMAALGPRSAEAWRLIGEASRLAFADRGRYMADIDFVPMPLRGLLDDDYLAERSKLLNATRALPREAVAPGTPPWDHAVLQGDDASIELPSTSHFSIVDESGNVVSMTTTIENGFGSLLMTGGFLLNNELTDFSFATHEDGVPIANRVEPGKRPRSSMAPTVVLRDGRPVLAVGSPGGSRIIGYVAKTLIAFIDWDMDIQAAISLPHLVNRSGPYDVEEGTGSEALAAELSALGFETNVTELNSGLHGIAITPDGLEGGADPRREGVALGN